MGYETSKFGDGSAAGSGNVVKTVSNHFGQRDTGSTGGVANSKGFENELTIDLSLDVLNGQGFPTEAPIIPKNSRILSAFLETTTPFTVTGTSPEVQIGTEGSEDTNGLVVTEVQLENAGTYNLASSLVGTWTISGGFGLTDLTTVGVALGGTNPVVAGDGQARVVVRYLSTNSQAPLSNFG